MAGYDMPNGSGGSGSGTRGAAASGAGSACGADAEIYLPCAKVRKVLAAEALESLAARGATVKVRTAQPA
eukprot:364940-Chlamydomonas_euryale.AAC.2